MEKEDLRILMAIEIGMKRSEYVTVNNIKFYSRYPIEETQFRLKKVHKLNLIVRDSSKNEVAYDKNETMTITVTDDGATLTDTKMYIDIWNVDDATPAGGGVHSLAYHKELAASYNGVWEISGSEMYGITHLVGAVTL